MHEQPSIPAPSSPQPYAHEPTTPEPAEHPTSHPGRPADPGPGREGRTAVRHAQALRRAERRRLVAARYGAAVVAAAAAYPGLAASGVWRFPAGVVCGVAVAAAVGVVRRAGASPVPGPRPDGVARPVAPPVPAVPAVPAGPAVPRQAAPVTSAAGPLPQAPQEAAPAAAAKEPPPAPTGRRRRGPAAPTPPAQDPQDTSPPQVGQDDPAAPQRAPLKMAVPRARERRKRAHVPGTRRTEEALRSLVREGWVIRPDLAAAFHGIAHVAVGPPGVFLLDSAHWDSDVVIDAAGVPHTRHLGGAGDLASPDRIPRQMRLAAAEHTGALAARLGGRPPFVQAVAVVWAPWDAAAVVADGVAYVRGEALGDWLRGRRPAYTPDEVAALVAGLAALPVEIGREYAR